MALGMLGGPDGEVRAVLPGVRAGLGQTEVQK